MSEFQLTFDVLEKQTARHKLLPNSRFLAVPTGVDEKQNSLPQFLFRTCNRHVQTNKKAASHRHRPHNLINPVCGKKRRSRSDPWPLLLRDRTPVTYFLSILSLAIASCRSPVPMNSSIGTHNSRSSCLK